MENINLLGAEQVKDAGIRMAGAAQVMQNAANQITEALDDHRSFMDDWLRRLGEALDARPIKGI